MPSVDLKQLVVRMSKRDKTRTEANLQSDLHTLLTVAPFDLEDHHLEEIVLEQQAGGGRRIDVEIGFTVFEVKRDLTVGNIRAEAEAQLAGYVQSRTDTMQQRYVGVLTDGAEWRLYHLADGALELVSVHEVSPLAPDVESLCVWLEGVLATTERVVPTPREITRRLGALSPGHALDYADLANLYDDNRNLPSVKLKRELWAKLLTTALGTNFVDEDRLFVEHTLLVITAEAIGHAVVGFDITDPTISPATLLSGGLFTRAQIGGVIEEDFFDWVIEVPGGDRWVRDIARRLSRFDWTTVEHDVMKVLYESVIDADQRHRLGEYYTPDWLADEIVHATSDKPLENRVLDPACGSGTFVFHAIRRYLAAAEAAGHDNATSIVGVTQHVLGIDVHPVAVTFARVTYLLAIGRDRLQADDRPAFAVPVYLGDSVQWGQERSLLGDDVLAIPTDDGLQLFSSELRFPNRLVADAGRFDQLVAELADKATKRQIGTAPPSLSATFRRFAVHADDQETITRTFTLMCDLYDQGRDHIWGYYVRNLARPTWLSQAENRVDVLVGNPPWLAYRYMTESMKADFRQLSQERSLWAGATVATNQDLSGLFITRCVELYLRLGGRFGFVMPLAALSRRQFAGFRTGAWGSTATQVTAELGQPWDLHQVKPSFFPVPGSVVFGTRTKGTSTALPEGAEEWAGRLPRANMARSEAAALIERTEPGEAAARGAGSAYASRFSQGATIVPKFLFFVETTSVTASPLGAGAGRVEVRSKRTAKEKRPWKDLPSLSGSVEVEFLRPVHLGDTVFPHRTIEPHVAVLPQDGTQLLSGTDDRLDRYPGLAAWWHEAERVWLANRSSERLTLAGQLDYRRKLTQQAPAAQHRIVYSASGQYLASAVVSDPTAVIEHKLYWAAAATLDEARYVTAVLNSTAITEAVRPLQSRGEHNPRDFDKYIWQLPIPLFDQSIDLHRELVVLAVEAEAVTASVDIVPGKSLESQRRNVRTALLASPAGIAIEAAVSRLLAP